MQNNIENYLASPFNLNSHKVNVIESFYSERIPLDEVIPGLATSQVGILVAPGGLGKSYYGLQLLFQICLGSAQNFSLGLKVQPKGPHNVIYLSFEDNKIIISKRLQMIKDFWSLHTENTSALDYAAPYLNVFSLARSNLKLVDPNGNTTKLYTSILNEAIALKPRIVIVDTLRRSHDSDENNNGSMSNVISHFEVLAERSQAAVLLLHHESKMGASGTSSSRGASSIVDSVRFMMRMQVMTKLESGRFNFSDEQRKNWVSVSTEKANYSPPLKSFWLKRTPGGVLIEDEPVALNSFVPEPTLKKTTATKRSYGWM